MANYATLIAAIQSVITQNGNNEITGPILQQTLISVVNSLGSGYQFIGIATPETMPGTPDQKVFYIGSSGTYPNFGPAVIPDGNLAVFYYDSSWHYGSVAFPLGDGAVTESKLAATLATKLFAAGYKYAGIATPETTPGTPTQNVFYIATSAGDYSNFGNIAIDENEFAILKYNNGVWTKDVTNAATIAQIESLNYEIGEIKNHIGLADDGGGQIDYKTDRVGYWVRYDTGALKQHSTSDYGTASKMRVQNFVLPTGINFNNYNFRAIYGVAASSNYSNFAAVAYYDENNTYISGVCFYQSGATTGNAEHLLSIPANTAVLRLFTYSDDAAVSPYLYYESKLQHNKTILFADPQLLTAQQQQQVRENLGISSGKTYRPNPSQTLLRAYNKDGSYITMASTSNGRTLVYEIPSDAENVRAYMSAIGTSATYVNCASVIYWDQNNNVVGWQYGQGDLNGNGERQLTIPNGTVKIGIWTNPYTDGYLMYDVGIIPVGEEDVLQLINGTKIPITLRGKNVSFVGDSISCFGTEADVRAGRYITPYYKVLQTDIGASIQSYVTWLDVYTTIEGTTRTNKTIGGVTLTPEMIGTLQTFTPVAADVDKCIGVPRWASHYTDKPWWDVFVEQTGCNFCANASWSGSRVVPVPVGNSRHAAFVLSELYSDYTIGRLRGRKSDGTFVDPDVIMIYRGTNDFSADDPAGVESLETPNMLSFNGITDEHNFTQCYIWAILKMRERFPNAFIILCTLNVFKRVNVSHFPANNGTYTLPDFNNKIREIANIMGCGLVEFDKDGITFENCYPKYISDNATTPTHPNTTGHLVMGEKAVADVMYILNH